VIPPAIKIFDSSLLFNFSVITTECESILFSLFFIFYRSAVWGVLCGCIESVLFSLSLCVVYFPI
jgi:hypothetical protein